MKNNKIFKKAALCAAICSSLTFYSSLSSASNVDGSIKGVVVQQQTDAPLAGASVIITNEQNGYSKTLVVDKNGQFNLNSIPVGQYNIRIEQQGYQTSELKDVTIGIGKSSSLEIEMTKGDVEVISVTGSRIARVDVTSSEASFNISAEELNRLPVAPDITSVALLAPGVNLGDSRFSDAKGNSLASFGGASQAENVYYVNGLNMTNFRNGVGGASIPFLAYKDFQVKTGGYSAEFGRSTGGVISSVTQSGSNEFKFGLQHRQNIDSLYGDRPSSYYQTDDCSQKIVDGEIQETCSNRIGDVISDNSKDSRKSSQTDIFASGAIIEDTLFFYGLYEMRDTEYTDLINRGNGISVRTDDDPYYLARLDWHINEDHSLMAWVFNDESTQYTTDSSYDENGNIEAGSDLNSNTASGGQSWSLRYNGNLTDYLSISAMAGKVEFNDTTRADGSDCPVIYDLTAGQNLGCWASFTIETNSDEREQYRFDVDWLISDNHNLRFGYDAEKNTSTSQVNLSGDIYYAYQNYEAGAVLPNGYTIQESDRYARVRNYEVGGSFGINNSAFYLEDIWNVTEQLTLNIGLRWESFENLNADGETFVEMKNQFAPRLGLAYDIFGDGEHKVFANLGRYHLPVASNTNVRLAGSELYTHDYYELDGVGADDVPVLGQKLGDTVVFGDGTAPSPVSVRDSGLQAMYQDEFILGYQGMINDDWSAGIKFTRRELKSVIDDASAEQAFASIGIDDDHFLLLNPGEGVSFEYDADGDGTLEQYDFTAEQLGYPDAKRNYNSVDLMLERAWDGQWMMKTTYTWAQSYGNAEGYVKSDNGQDDAGLTTDWDFPYLMDGAYGSLPNDRRHSLKIFGSYALTEELVMGINTRLTSGRPRNALGAGYAPDQDAYHYGDTYYVGDTKFSRGSFGRTPWTATVDMNFKYDLSNIDLFESAYVALNVYNLFDASNVTNYEEIAENDAAFNANAQFGVPVSWQAPRRVEMIFNMMF
ncbi:MULTISPECIES: TonB-dependent receptor [unclassified Pseudoalteromonas]|uniref:TonB-dependent receptor n=1 Tax=unclassified Pseudoalteromonas TaxID=194690 RepID=UPI0025B4B31D|nr:MULTISPECIES: TonB-dependent receptor [unclassified Pseudoalteromonas]MDN3379858.1 TonB-dependent receptor [Pseudoalteromonas sp. APC 3893]MDN3388197.1 TonB-dependent receptor [Pseudoalteromonas sp. APC 4017]